MCQGGTPGIMPGRDTQVTGWHRGPGCEQPPGQRPAALPAHPQALPGTAACPCVGKGTLQQGRECPKGVYRDFPLDDGGHSAASDGR